MSVTNIRITASQLLPRIRSAAADSSNVVFVPPPQKRSMAGMMQFRQVMLCLQDGTIVGKPKLTEHGLWEFRMERYAANQLFSLKVAAEVKGVRVVKLYAIQEK